MDPFFFLMSVSFPFDEVLESLMVDSMIDDAFNFVLLFSLDYFWWWEWLAGSVDIVLMIWG